jgi:hypothetical protein
MADPPEAERYSPDYKCRELGSSENCSSKHNLKVASSNLAPATILLRPLITKEMVGLRRNRFCEAHHELSDIN